MTDPPIRTAAEALASEADRIGDLLAELIAMSAIEYRPDPPSNLVWVGRSEHYWADLDTGGRKLQSNLRDRYREFVDLSRVLLRNVPDSEQKRYNEWIDSVRDVIVRENQCWYRLPEEALAKARASLHSQVAALRELYDPREGAALVVPDTNALLYAPDLERWRFEGLDEFFIVLTPAVLSELDELKVKHAREEVREKSEGVIRRIKEYRRRARQAGGTLADGAILAKGVSQVVTVATEPDFSATLPWLDRENRDDRIIASFVEVLRAHPHSISALITRDINLQNKAEAAKLPYLEPPEASRISAVARNVGKSRKQ